MKKNITYLCMAAAALLVSSCTQNEEITPTIENEGRVPVLFIRSFFFAYGSFPACSEALETNFKAMDCSWY